MTLNWPTAEVHDRRREILDDPRGRRIGVLGLGVAGRAMAMHLARRGARVVGADVRTEIDTTDLKDSGIELLLGEMAETTFDGVEALTLSPGADPRQPAVQAAVKNGVPVFGELELAGELPARVAAITGTNGKSTTTALLAALVQSAGRSTFVGGNFGEPIVVWLDRQEPTDVAVLELSSFQLETAYSFKPQVAVVLNVSPDHGDRYADIDEYALAKQHIVEHLDPTGVAVLNHDDERVVAMASATQARVWWFSTRKDRVPGSGAVLRGDTLVPSGEAAGLGEIDLSHSRLLGRHNRENAIAAFLALCALGMMQGQAYAAYQDFRGLEHRLEWVAEIGGVAYINDSKATNDDSAAVALRAMDRPVVLLVGGHDKGAGYSQTRQAALDAARVVIAFGAASEAIAASMTDHPSFFQEPTMQAAVVRASQLAHPGDVVLLAPACSSFDEFANYRDRGGAFKAQVAELAKRGEP